MILEKVPISIVQLRAAARFFCGDEWNGLPSGYFRRVEKDIGKDVLAAEEHVLVVIWLDDLPVHMVYLRHGEILEHDVIKSFRELDPWGIMQLAESEGVKVFDYDWDYEGSEDYRLQFKKKMINLIYA